MGRIENAKRNILFGYIGNILKLFVGFLLRTVFIYTLGVTYLGVNGLYANILSVLSLAELGIGTAMNYSLYKPVAENDYNKIKSLMYLYKRAYKSIAFFILFIGLSLLPFLKYIIKEPGKIGNEELLIYYLIFLFNTVSTYFVSYKYSLVNAEQKGYIQTNIHTLTYIVTTLVQVITLLIFKNFLLYLLFDSAIGLIQKIYVNKFLNKLYPYLRDKNIKKLSKEETTSLKKNVKALIYHKIGEISVHQTDNIIISSFINVMTVGVVSNYSLLITSVGGFINIIFNSVISGLGNLIVTENQEKQYQIFKVYRFLAFWLYGFATIAFFELLTPFITIWIGDSMIISQTIIGLILVNYYFLGHRIVISNFKIAAGIFEEDKYIAIIQALVNLILSIVLVQKFGLVGVYIGTIVSGLVSSFYKPSIVYRKIFNKNVWEYYKDSIIYIIVIVSMLLILELIKKKVIFEINTLGFSLMVLFVTVIPNFFFYILFRNRDEFKYLINIIKIKLFRRM